MLEKMAFLTTLYCSGFHRLVNGPLCYFDWHHLTIIIVPIADTASVRPYARGVSWHFMENTRKEWSEKWMLIYPDHLQNWFDFGHGLLTFLNFIWWNGSNLEVQGIFWKTYGKNYYIIGTQMYVDHLWKYLDFGHGLIILLILTQFRLSDRVKFSASMIVAGEE